MSPKKIQLSFTVLNLFMAVLNSAFLLVGLGSMITLLVIPFSLFAAKVCWDGYKRSSY